MSSCVFPGSFDPVTAGHMDIIKRAAAVFDTVRVTVMINVNKQGTIPVEDRIRMLKKACREIPNVPICPSSPRGRRWKWLSRNSPGASSSTTTPGSSSSSAGPTCRPRLH